MDVHGRNRFLDPLPLLFAFLLCAFRFFFAPFGCPVFGQSADFTPPYPLIEVLNSSDASYRQAVEDINRYYRSVYSNSDIPPLGLFSYKPKGEDSIFSVAARFNLAYDTIASLNGLRNPDALLEAEYLVIPNQQGLFIPVQPSNDLEKLMRSWRGDSVLRVREIVIAAPRGKRRFYFFPGENFHAVERSFFLNVLFRFPLPTGVVSSGFGMRISPFSHKEHFHNGIDIAAPAGTEVFAAAAGKVSAAGADAVLGNYVVLVHRGNFSTIYGHLLERRINAGQNVGAGDIIGTVGSTGMSTGPHLHFEIRNAGEPWNPSEIFTQ